VLNEAEYIIAHYATVRDCAKYFGISKSTVHNDMRQRLLKLNKPLYEKVRKISDQNLRERHIRGGLATKRKYALLKG
jgi:putative DeoR family transcriptional regulator (stage III sporulation protein D)